MQRSGTPSTDSDEAPTEQVSMSSGEWRQTGEEQPSEILLRPEGDRRCRGGAEHELEAGQSWQFATAETARLNVLFRPETVPQDTIGRMDQVHVQMPCN